MTRLGFVGTGTMGCADRRATWSRPVTTCAVFDRSPDAMAALVAAGATAAGERR